jgi:Protein of unknown function (DUF3142)
MIFSCTTARQLLLPLLFAALCVCTRGDREAARTAIQMTFATVMPQTVVWAWEEPEDLRSAPPDSVGVAFLAETLFVGTNPALHAPTLRVVPRHQPLAVAPGAAVMAVVRVIALPNFEDRLDLRQQTADVLAEAAHREGVRALQIDFDATRSQHAFYAGVLRLLRARMPAAMPLSITALLSWCAAEPANGDWLAALPINEAVPMFFRLGGSARPARDKSGYALREPLCQGSRGISIDESWPPPALHARTYVFAPRPWTPLQLAALEDVRRGRRALALQQGYSEESRQPNDTGLLSPNRFTAADNTVAHPSRENLP